MLSSPLSTGLMRLAQGIGFVEFDGQKEKEGIGGERQSRGGEKIDFVMEEGNRTRIQAIPSSRQGLISLGLGRATNWPLVRVARDRGREKEREGGRKEGGRAEVSERRRERESPVT